jgi:hypothetical protein
MVLSILAALSTACVGMASHLYSDEQHMESDDCFPRPLISGLERSHGMASPQRLTLAFPQRLVGYRIESLAVSGPSQSGRG